ncbi:ABC transporter ATP-binding protein [Peribacillus simplex]|uniref:ABC transporter ATP-binding protein n=1 Tax=Peribacillus simplex TaxID=1478 RepID=UPI003D29FF27
MDQINTIKLCELTKKYKGVPAVNGIEISVKKGEIFAFLGSNGAGKTTTMKMMTAQTKPTKGKVLFNGVDIWKDSSIRQVAGYVPDIPLLHEGLTPREMLMFMGGLYGLGKETIHERTDELLTKLELSDRGDHLIKEFSLGMKRKVSVACAMIHKPQILLLDEVTNGLDPRSTRTVKDMLFKAAFEDNTTIFITTHILDVVEEMADRIAIIHKGEIKGLGTLSELSNSSEMNSNRLENIFLSLTS